MLAILLRLAIVSRHEGFWNAATLTGSRPTCKFIIVKLVIYGKGIVYIKIYNDIFACRTSY
jgi:hypothetical protein